MSTPETTTDATIVVVWAREPAGDAALDLALESAPTYGVGRVVLIDATRIVASADPRLAHPGTLEDAEARVRAAGLELQTLHLEGKDAADLVLDTAEETGAALIAIGLRRRTPIGKLVLGATSQRILLESGLPVLTVRA